MCPSDAEVVVCHGKPRCAKEWDEDFETCDWCYRFSPDDPRTDEQIVEDMKQCH